MELEFDVLDCMELEFNVQGRYALKCMELEYEMHEDFH